MEVRLDHVLDGDAEPLRGLNVLIDIALRVDDHRLAALRDQIGSVREAGQVEGWKCMVWRSRVPGLRGLAVCGWIRNSATH